MEFTKKIKMKAVGPNVLVKVSKKYNDKIIIGEKEIYFDPAYNPTWNVTTVGEVIGVPDTQPYSIEKQLISPILQVGDIVYFRYITVESDVTTVVSDFNNEEREMIKRMEYDDIFCTIRNGEIIPVGGWILGVPELEGEGVEELVDDGRGNKKRTKVKYLNKALNLIESYSDVLDKKRARVKYKSSYVGEESNVNVGDIVFGGSLNFLNTIQGQEYYCFKENQVMMVFN